VPSPGSVRAAAVIGILGAAAVEACKQSNCFARPGAYTYVNHHIIAQKAQAAWLAREIWTVDLGQSINSLVNIVQLPQYMHWYLHSGSYYLQVNVAVMTSYYGAIQAGTNPLDAVSATLRAIAATLKAESALTTVA
jgi:hypothetical protein